MAWTKARVIGSTALVERTVAFSLLADESQRPFQDLKSSHDDVQIHPVDGFHFQNDVLVQHFGHRLW